jgi:hypothetical protein
MVEVFKTNVQRQKQAILLLKVLSQKFPLFRINFDLDDCDKILRVEGENICHERIIELFTTNGCQCNVLE